MPLNEILSQTVAVQELTTLGNEYLEIEAFNNSAAIQYPEVESCFPPLNLSISEDNLPSSDNLRQNHSQLPGMATAPSLFDISFQDDELLYQESEISAAAVSNSLPNEYLEAVYNNNIELQNHRIMSNDVARNDLNSISNNDITNEFYKQLLEYENAHLSLHKSTVKLRLLQQTCHSISSSIWNLKKTNHSIEEKCGDGVRCVHRYTSEMASLNIVEIGNLEDSLKSLHDLIYNNAKISSFQIQLGKLWIQNFIDEFLLNLNLCHDSSLGDEFEKLHYLLRVTFFFEKRANMNDKDGYDIDLMPLIKDLRLWIAQLVSALLKFGSLRDHRLLFLHILRCEGFSLSSYCCFLYLNSFEKVLVNGGNHSYNGTFLCIGMMISWTII